MFHHFGKSGFGQFQGHQGLGFNRLNVEIGTRADDMLTGTDGRDLIKGLRGDDLIALSSGRDTIDGGHGFDTVTLGGTVADYAVTGYGHRWCASPMAITVATLNGAPESGRSILRNVEALYFAGDDYTRYFDGTNNAVLAGDDAATTGEDAALTLTAADLLSNDREFDGDTMTIASVEGSSILGALVSFDGGTVTYTPGDQFDLLAAGETVTDRFTYTVDDGMGGSDTATVYVTVTGANDQPELQLASTVTVEEGQTAVTTADAYDIDGDALTYSLSGDDAALFTIGADGAIAFAAAPDYEAPADTGADNVYDITVTVDDGNGGSDSADLAVTVSDVSEISAEPRINEFHYDNTGGDTGEFVEIRVNAGAAVSGLSITLYNGNGGSAYGSHDLSSLTPGSDGTYDYYTIPTPGLQNGNDGIALVQDGAVVEFLSYEGAFTAVGGPADGMTATDIGIGEPGTTAIGDSLQLGSDGIWFGPAANTAGAANDAATTAALVITEIMQNPSAVSDSAGEWFEIHNPGTADVDINGWTLSDNDSDSHTIDHGGPLIVPAGGYLVLGNNADTATNGGVPVAYSYGSGFYLSNGADELVLTDASGTEIDRVEWDGGPAFPDPNGASMALTDPALDNNDGATWTTATDPYGDGDLGTPGTANDGGTGTVALTDLRINELHYDNASTDTGEFVEIRVNAGADVSTLSVELYNGNGGGLYGTYTLAAAASTDGTFDYYVVDTPGLQNGNDAIALVNDGTVAEFLSYEGPFTATDGTANGLTATDIGVFETTSTPAGDSLQRNDDGSWNAPAAETRGTANSGTTTGGGDAPLLTINQVQGSGYVSPYEDQTVQLEAIVTHITGTGFYLQEDDADLDAMTSEGIFVFTGGGDAVALGDLVTVTGTVEEYFGMTELTDVTELTVISNETIPDATIVMLSPGSAQDFEAVEGMLVQVDSGISDEALTVIENYNLARYGEIVISAGTQTQPTQIFDAQTQASEIDVLMAANANNRLILDDGSSAQNPDEFVYLPGGAGDNGNGYLDSGDDFSDTGTTVRLGAEVDGSVTGIMNYGFGDWRVTVTDTITFDEDTNVGARTDTPEDVGGTLQVASYNVLNFFTTIDVSGAGTGPSGTLDPRGADSVEEFERQSTKIVEGIIASGAEVLALQEIENNGSGAGSAIATLTDLLNAEGTAADYAWVDPTGSGGFIGTDAITTGIVYDDNAVELVHADYLVFDEPSAAITYDITADLAAAIGVSNPVGDYDRNRPSVAATFMDEATGETFTVVSSHFKSKGDSGLQDIADDAEEWLATNGSDATVEALLQQLYDDPNFDQGDGQGFWNGVRTDAAMELAAWVETDYNGGGVDNVLFLGDMNAYAEEDPVQYLDDVAGYTDLIDSYIGQDSAYSYVFDGQQGTLDQGFADDALASAVTGVTEWHINADEPNLIGYDTSFTNSDFYNPGVFASSDHDPLIVGLQFGDGLLVG